MPPQIAALINNQHGLITRRQALGAGLTPREIDREVASGRWVRVRRGTYCIEHIWAGAERWDERQVIIDRAARLRINRPHVASHHTSGLLLGMGLLKPPSTTTHVTRPGVIGSQLRHGVKHHLAPYGDHEVLVVDGTAVLSPARTALDIARELGFRHGLVAVDSALRIGATAAELERSVAAMKSWPFVENARRCIAASDPDTDSVAETLARELVEELGFGRPRTQFGLCADGRTRWCDLILGRHVFEVHGRIKWQTPEEGGVSDDPRQSLFDDKKRHDWISGFKLGISGIFWDDLVGAGRATALTRLRREYLDTVARFGTDRSDLDQFRPRTPRRRNPPPNAA